jgi:hypothetical protein
MIHEHRSLTRREEEVARPIVAAAAGCLRTGCIAAAGAVPVPGTGSTTCLLGLQWVCTRRNQDGEMEV